MNKLRSVLRQSIMEIVLLVLCGYLAVKAPGFLFDQDGNLATGNLLGILRNISMQGIIALGMTMVIIAGEIDLSVGAAVAFAGCLTAWLVQFLVGAKMLWPMPVAVLVAALVAVVTGGGIGCLSGWLRVRFNVPTFIATLAWMTVLRGAAGDITNGFPITPFPEWFSFLGSGYVWRIPFPAIVFVVVFALIQFLMGFTAFGRSIYAVGGNLEAARLSGINVNRVKVLVMGIVGLLAALAGIMQAAQIGAGSSSTAVGWELDVISAVIIGGTSLMGGAGRVWGTMIGMVFLGVLANGMTLLNVSEYRQLEVRGGLILVAVLLNMRQTK
jgi:ribose/xylose/arabinose/galactoside ABC-type transport system permease subunit